MGGRVGYPAFRFVSRALPVWLAVAALTATVDVGQARDSDLEQELQRELNSSTRQEVLDRLWQEIQKRSDDSA